MEPEEVGKEEVLGKKEEEEEEEVVAVASPKHPSIRFRVEHHDHQQSSPSPHLADLSLNARPSDAALAAAAFAVAALTAISAAAAVFRHWALVATPVSPSLSSLPFFPP